MVPTNTIISKRISTLHAGEGKLLRCSVVYCRPHLEHSKIRPRMPTLVGKTVRISKYHQVYSRRDCSLDNLCKRYSISIMEALDRHQRLEMIHKLIPSILFL